MRRYVYRAMREPGVVISGEIDGDNPQAATSILLSRGYHVLDIVDAQSKGAVHLRETGGLWWRTRKRDVVDFSRDLSTLLRAGLSLSQSLDRIRTRSAKPVWAMITGGIQARLEDGLTFSNALRAYPAVFDEMYVNLIGSGEEAGNLVEVLERLAQVGEHRLELQSRVKLALVYPGAMLLMGLITVTLLMVLVVPIFVDVFRQAGQELPWPTLILITISEFVGGWWWALLGGVVAGLYPAGLFVKSPAGREVLGFVSLRLPLFGKLIRQMQVSAFARTLGVLIGNGITVLSAMGITAKTLSNTQYQNAVRGMVPAIREGSGLGKLLAASPLFPAAAADTIVIGEESGALSERLLQLADENERDVERQLKVLMALLEPGMIVFVGALVGFIVLAVILPVFDLGGTVQ